MFCKKFKKRILKLMSVLRKMLSSKIDQNKVKKILLMRKFNILNFQFYGNLV